jgi:hypothetical protein
MIRKLELDSLSAEASSLDQLLGSRTAAEDPIGYFQYSQRLAELRDEISHMQDVAEHSASVALFFAGRPVIGSRGIRADFAGKAVEVFQDMVSKRFAANEVGELGQRGRIPLRSNSDLMLTDVARGSFGVVLEESVETVPFADTQLKVVLDEVVSSMQKAVSVDGESFEELLEDIDNRYLRSLGAFFELLDESDATLRIVEGDNDRQLDGEEIHRGRERTSAAEIQERDDQQLVGVVYLLPAHRRFELVLDSGESIWGPVSREFAAAHLEATRAANDVVGHRWRVRALARTVIRPNREPKTTHRLLGLIERLD